MPIPFLLIGIGAATAAVGVGKTVKAGIDSSEAKNKNEEADKIIKESSDIAKKFRANSGAAITSLGETKIKILDEGIQRFVDSFEKLRNVDLSDSVGMEELQKFRIDKQSLQELREMQNMASSIIGGMAGGAAAGAVTAFGALGAATAFGAASTGTALATLSGAAATNATLAFFGGGSLAVGGLGIAGGTAVLGGLVAGPALAVMGFVIGAKASENLDNARSNLAKAKEYREELKNAMVLCQAIRLRANMFERLLLKLNVLFEPMVFQLEKIIEKSGTDFSKYTMEEKKCIAASMSLAGAIKSVLDTPILTDDGTLTPESEKISTDVNAFLVTQNG